MAGIPIYQCFIFRDSTENRITLANFGSSENDNKQACNVTSMIKTLIGQNVSSAALFWHDDDVNTIGDAKGTDGLTIAINPY